MLMQACSYTIIYGIHADLKYDYKYHYVLDAVHFVFLIWFEDT